MTHTTRRIGFFVITVGGLLKTETCNWTVFGFGGSMTAQTDCPLTTARCFFLGGFNKNPQGHEPKKK